jgi:hypothetical protein
MSLAAAILSRVRSEMISRSNCANDSRMFRVSRPMLWVVLNCCVTLTNETPWRSKVCTTRAKSIRLRERRSTNSCSRPSSVLLRV